jgi:hypothetical protein
VKKEIAEGDTGKPPVKDPSPFHSPPEENQSFGPEGIGIFYRKAGQGKANECHHHHQVDETMKDIESPIDLSLDLLPCHGLNPFSSTIHELF